MRTATNYPGYHLEYNTSLGATHWAAFALTPVVTSTNFAVTNSLFGAQKYYRLSKNLPVHVAFYACFELVILQHPDKLGMPIALIFVL